MFGKARLAAIAGCAALIAAVPGTAEARGGCVPGAPDIGDPYVPGYGNGGYDVRHYDLDVAYDPRTDVLDGDATIRATATQSLCSLNLDLVGLDVRRVDVDGRRAAFTRSGRELTITPRRPLRRGRPFEIEVRYDGVPIELGDPDFRRGFMKTEDGVTVAGQPDAAAAWFPVNDHPLDKASYTFDVTVPEGYEVVANGSLRDRDRRHGWTTWEWEARQPMASYLTTIDVGFWDVRTWRTERGLPVLDAVDSAITGALRERIDASLSRQGEILEFLSGAFGPYPFSTVGAIVESQDDFHFALETQTRPVYGKWPWQDDQALGDSIVVHELAHQWFGNHVSLAHWQDLWLNEGFASYAEWLWGEREGLGTAQELFEDLHADPTLDDEFWSVKVADTGIDLFFHPAVYLRGAMTLHVLRNEVGDEDFFAILRAWTATHGGGHGTTPEFIALAEQVSGEQLDGLFDAWLFTPGKPTLGAPQARARSASSKWSQHARRRLHIRNPFAPEPV